LVTIATLYSDYNKDDYKTNTYKPKNGENLGTSLALTLSPARLKSPTTLSHVEPTIMSIDKFLLASLDLLRRTVQEISHENPQTQRRNG